MQVNPRKLKQLNCKVCRKWVCLKGLNHKGVCHKGVNHKGVCHKGVRHKGVHPKVDTSIDPYVSPFSSTYLLTLQLAVCAGELTVGP